MEHIFVKDQFESLDNIEQLSHCISQLEDTNHKIFKLKEKYDMIGFAILYCFIYAYIFPHIKASHITLGLSIFGTMCVSYMSLIPFYIINNILNVFQWRKKLNTKFFSRFTKLPQLNFLQKKYTTILEEAIEDQNFQYKVVSFLQKISASYSEGTYKGQIDNDLHHLVTFFNQQDYSSANNFIITNIKKWDTIKSYSDKTLNEKSAYESYMAAMKKNHPSYSNEEISKEHGATINLKSIL